MRRCVVAVLATLIVSMATSAYTADLAAGLPHAAKPKTGYIGDTLWLRGLATVLDIVKVKVVEKKRLPATWPPRGPPRYQEREHLLRGVLGQLPPIHGLRPEERCPVQYEGPQVSCGPQGDGREWRSFARPAWNAAPHQGRVARGLGTTLP